MFYSATMLTHKKNRQQLVNIPRVEGQGLSKSEVLEKLNQDDEDKKSKQLKKCKIDFSEASDETQCCKCNIQKNGNKKKTSRGAKSVAEFGKKHFQLKTACGTNVKLLVASLVFVNCVYPKNTKNSGVFLHEKVP